MNNHKGISTLLISAFLTFSIITFLNPDNIGKLSEENIIFISKIKATEVKPKLIVKKPIRKFSRKAVRCLARNIYFEARNESILGQHAVAWVTVNRMEHDNWPNTICKVVHQRYQFSWTIKYRYNKTYNKSAYKRAVLIAKDTLHESQTGGEDLSGGALFYHADYVNPSWNKRVVKIAQIETHIFYK